MPMIKLSVSVKMSPYRTIFIVKSAFSGKSDSKKWNNVTNLIIHVAFVLVYII